MKFKYKPLLVLLIIVPILSACVNNLSFDDINLQTEPIFNTPLVSFELDQLDFYDIDNSVEIETVTDITNIEFFESSTFQNDLLRFDLIVQVSKNFERIFTIKIDFLDENDNTAFSVPLMVFEQTRTLLDARTNIDVSDFPGILDTSKVKVSIRIVPGAAAVDPDIEKKFGFKSVGVFYFRL